MADPAPTPDPTPAPTPPAPADPAQPNTPDPAAKTPPWGDPENFNAEKAWDLIQTLRASDRPGKVSDLEKQVADLEAARQAQLDTVAKTLGLKPDDSPPDPAKLAEQIAAEQDKTAAAQTRADAAERRLAIFMAAPAHEGNALALLDSTSFLASIAEVDHTDETKLGEAIAAAIEKNPLFKTGPTTPPLQGGPRTPAPARAGSLEEAIAARFSSSTR